MQLNIDTAARFSSTIAATMIAAACTGEIVTDAGVEPDCNAPVYAMEPDPQGLRALPGTRRRRVRARVR